MNARVVGGRMAALSATLILLFVAFWVASQTPGAAADPTKKNDPIAAAKKSILASEAARASAVPKSAKDPVAEQAYRQRLNAQSQVYSAPPSASIWPGVQAPFPRQAFEVSNTCRQVAGTQIYVAYVGKSHTGYAGLRLYRTDGQFTYIGEYLTAVPGAARCVDLPAEGFTIEVPGSRLTFDLAARIFR